MRNENCTCSEKCLTEGCSCTVCECTYTQK